VELRHLEHFVAVAEERNFTRAARRLHLVQSALSVSVRSLERELDTRLFERTTREVRLTDAGRVLLPEARRTLDAAASAQAAVFGAQAGLRGTLRLGMMQVISVVDVGSLIARFHRERPLVDIQPRTAPGGSAAMISDVRRGALDAAFVAVSGLDQPGLTATTLASEPVLLGCLPDHPLARRAVVSVGELADEPFVDFTPGWGTRTVADQLFAKAVQVNPHSSTALMLWSEAKALEGNRALAKHLKHLSKEQSAVFENYGEIAALYFKMSWENGQPVTMNKFVNPSVVTFH